MKVHIITLHYINHYGSLLQSYATCKAFAKLGLEPEIIDYQRPNSDEKEQLKSALKVRGYKPFSLKGILFSMVKKIENRKTKKFSDEFRDKYVPMTRHYKDYKDLKCNPPMGDIYVTGSDQTWNSEYNGGVLPAYYLDFAPEGKKRLGYSVSIGMSEIPENERDQTREYINKYAAISVRENTAKTIIEDLDYSNVTHILDPTLVLDQNDWKPLIAERMVKEKYIVIYKLNSTPEIEEFARQLSKDTGYKIVRMSYYINHLREQGKMFYSPSVEEFLSLIYHAEYVITDSFHCLAFSLNFEKEFFTIFPGKYNDRLNSLMELTNTQDRLVTDPKVYCREAIDYDYVNDVLKKERDKAMSFIMANCKEID